MNVRNSNEWSKKYYEQYLAEGDFEQAELFKPNEQKRDCNPAGFEMRDFEQTTHNSFPKNWETETNGDCWETLGPALIEVGEATIKKIKKLNVDKEFELSVNSEKDWYDITWQ